MKSVFISLFPNCDDSVHLITNLGSISVSPGNVVDAVTTVLLKQVLLSIGCAAASFSSAHSVLQEEGAQRGQVETAVISVSLGKYPPRLRGRVPGPEK